MKDLLAKEIRLAMHPTALLFLPLSAMLLIPNYPYYVVFFYTGLAVFFTCLAGRENHDVFYTLSLPVRKRDIVKARYALVVGMQLAQMVLALPFAALRQSFSLPGNQVGMDANIAFFGFSFVMLGIFNLVFFAVYYADTDKVGKAFNLSSIAVAAYMIVAEACAHVVPFVRDRLDTKDPLFLSEKLLVLFLGALFYTFATLASCRKSIALFERLDL
jgi:magnesium-transporting ATPase (P-type)